MDDDIEALVAELLAETEDWIEEPPKREEAPAPGEGAGASR